MRKREFLFVFALLSTFPLWGQVVQKGIVVELSSGNRPVAGVEILVAGATPTVSDANGQFQLYLPAAQTGDPLPVNKVYKRGYEIVNELEIKKRNVSASVPLKIVLCQTGVLEESRRNYYQIGEDLYYRQYTVLTHELKNEQQRGKLDKSEYEKRLEKYKMEFNDSMNKLYYYADLFARINKDELSRIDSHALALLEAGKVDEAINVYEESGLVEEFYEKSDRFLSNEQEN